MKLGVGDRQLLDASGTTTTVPKLPDLDNAAQQWRHSIECPIGSLMLTVDTKRH
jgi:hypothetical protein